MSTITVEATLGLALACARSFGAAVTRAACDVIAQQVELEELARGPLQMPRSGALGAVAPNTAVPTAAKGDLVVCADSAAVLKTNGAGQGDDRTRASVMFEQIAAVEPLTLSAAGRVQFLKAAIAHTAWTESRVNAAMLAMAGVTRRIHVVQIGIEGTRAERIEIEDAARSEIALAARWSEAQAQHRLESARLMHGLLPATCAALASGVISHAHASVITEGAARLALGVGIDITHPGTDRDSAVWQELVAVATQLDGRATQIAARSTRTHTRSAVMRIVDTLNPAGMRARRETAKATHDVWVQAEGDGNALLIARMNTLQANACLNRIRQHAQAAREHAATAGNPDRRRIGQLRVGVLADAILSASHGLDPVTRDRRLVEVDLSEDAAQALSDKQRGSVMLDVPTRSGIRADIQVLITLEALLGLQAINGASDTAILRGRNGDDELVPAAEIRDLLSGDHAEVTLRRLVTDPLSGHLLDASPRRYKPSHRLRDFIQTRDVRCRWQGCNARATSTRSDLDHAQPFDTGGATTRANLGVLCRRHHLLKTHESYEISNSEQDGSCMLTTPAGHTYPHEPMTMLPDDAADVVTANMHSTRFFEVPPF
jgi:hypothetical protein